MNPRSRDRKSVCVALAFDATLESHPGEAPGHDDIRGTLEAARAALRSRGFSVVPLPVSAPDEVRRLVRAIGPDVVMNMVEGLQGVSRGEIEVARELERSGVPFTGCPAGALELGLDKHRTKAALASWGLPVPRGAVMDTPSPDHGLRFPLIVKCLREDASLGLDDSSIVHDDAALRDRVARLVAQFRQPAIVEEFIGGREFNVAVVGPRPTALPVSEIDFSAMPAGKPRFVSYKAKWATESVEYRSTVPVCPAPLEPVAAARLRRLAIRAFRLLGCRDAARVDFRTDLSGKPYILEVNPNPDLSPDAGLARSVRAHGWAYEEFIERLVGWAAKRKDGVVSERIGSIGQG